MCHLNVNIYLPEKYYLTYNIVYQFCGIAILFVRYLYLVFVNTLIDIKVYILYWEVGDYVIYNQLFMLFFIGN